MMNTGAMPRKLKRDGCLTSGSPELAYLLRPNTPQIELSPPVELTVGRFGRRAWASRGGLPVIKQSHSFAIASPSSPQLR